LNVYSNNVDWSGKIIDEDLDFTFSIGEDSGIYINGNMLKVDQDFIDLMNKLQKLIIDHKVEHIAVEDYLFQINLEIIVIVTLLIEQYIF
jgi:hypothetical protein